MTLVPQNTATDKLIERYFMEKGLPLDRAVAFSDVYIVDRTSRIGRRSDIRDLGTEVAKGVALHIPLIPANMMDVTESRMAIAIARAGGVGFIHQFLPIAERVNEVKKVKRADNEVIENPWSVEEDTLLVDALQFAREKGISGVLVVDKKGKLAGILTSRDVRFAAHRFGKKLEQAKVKDLMTKMPLVVGKEHIRTEEAMRLLEEHKIEKLPLIDRAMRPVGLVTAKDILKRSEHPLALRDKKGQLIVGATVGISGSFFEDAAALIHAKTDVILVDTARGNSIRTRDAVRAIHRKFPQTPIVAGNVDTAEGALLLMDAGATGIKVGIGPGSACKTRVTTGIGNPQLSAIAECVAVARGRGIPVIADGGIKDGADFAKAIAAGADCVMSGSLFAGTEETPGEVYYDSGERYKLYRGSAGLDSQIARLDDGGLDGVRAPEGVTRKILFKGESAFEMIDSLLQNLRSSMSYANARSIEEFHRATFHLQTRAGYEEGKPRS
jgi:IMP dehydrogenase